MSTFQTIAKVTVNGQVFHQINAFTCSSSWEQLSDTATITLPLGDGSLVDSERFATVAETFRPGMYVTVELGYWTPKNEWMFNEFSGFVKKVNLDIPLVLECEDSTYLLRRCKLEKQFKNAKLKEICDFILAEANKAGGTSLSLSRDVSNMKIDSFRLNNVNGADALQKLKDDYGLAIYFRGTELFAGLAYTQFSEAKKVKFHLQKNVCGEQLTYRRAEDVKIKLKAIGMKKDNSTIEVEVGDEDGEQRTKIYTNVSDEAALKALAKSGLSSFKFSGYEGSVDTKLLPEVRHSWTGQVIDPLHNRPSGNYLVNSVQTSFTMDGGIVRTCELGIKL